MASDLTDRVIIITGASSGIGAATARACARAGMDCVLNGRDAERLAAVADEVRALGRKVVTVAGDVTEPGLNVRLLDTAEKEFGKFDVVFANAGYGFTKPTLELELDELRRIFEVNFFAGFELLWHAGRRLLAAKRRGHLLMCSSAVAKFTLRGFAAYSATKAAQNHVCRAMRMELRPRGTEVSSVHPITTRTGFFDSAAKYVGRHEPWEPRGVTGLFVQDPERVAAAIVRCLRRPRPEVWASTLVRVAAGLMTIFPGLMDLVGRRA